MGFGKLVLVCATVVAVSLLKYCSPVVEKAYDAAILRSFIEQGMIPKVDKIHL